MDDALALHYRLLDEEHAAQRCRDALGYLEEAGIGHVVEGGWAVAAYGSPVASVDLDIILSFDALEDFKSAMLERHGLQLDATGTRVLGIDVRDLHAHNGLFDHADRGYVPADVLTGNLERRQVLDGIDAPVPSLDVLTMMKAKAWHDRRMAWEASRDPVRLARLGTENQGWVRGQGVLHWTRKAGKDLFDLAFLQSKGATCAFDDIVDAGTAEAIRRSLEDPPLPLGRFARQMADRHRLALGV